MFTILDDKKQIWSIPLIDFHTHIGRVPIETTKGSSQRINRPQDILDLYEKLKFELFKKIKSNQDNYYINLPDHDSFVQPLYPIVKDQIYKDIKSKGWIADQIVSFPFNDIFHLQTKPKFVKSNDYVLHSLTKFEFAFRFIPFCRVDATEQNATQEILRSATQGAKGLKLHPLSQHWIEKIVSPETKTVLRTAGKLKLPVIFDVPNKGVAKDITTIANDSRENFESEINVILGHNGFDYSSKDMFDCVNNKYMYTEISGMRGSDVGIFFKNVMQIDNWTDKILFGTDSNYFSVLQATDFISFLLSNEFLDLLSSKTDNKINPLIIVAKILGLNALRLIPLNYQNNNEIGLKFPETKHSNFIKVPQINFVSSIKKLIQNNKIIVTPSLIQQENKLIQIINLQIQNEIHQLKIESTGQYSQDFLLLQKLKIQMSENFDIEFDPTLIVNRWNNAPLVDEQQLDLEKVKTISSIEDIIL